MLNRKHGTRTSIAGLNFIVNQQYAVLLKQRFNFAEIRRRRHNHAAVPLNRFYNHCGDTVALLFQNTFQALNRPHSGLFQRQLRMIRPFNKGNILIQIIIRPPHLQAGYTHCKIGPPVQAALQRNKALASGMHSGQQQCSFISFRAAVHKKAPAQLARQHSFQPFCEIYVRLCQIHR
ncbi:hypothetical protein D3C75_917270 [compost metagenome]